MSNKRDHQSYRKLARKIGEQVDKALQPPALRDDVSRYAGDPSGFLRALVDPETGQPFEVYEAEERFFVEAVTLTAEGRLPYPELVFSAPKKSGKTTLAAAVLIYVVRVIGGRYAEGYCVANDFDQAQGRVFEAAKRIIESTPILQGTADLLKDRILFHDPEAAILALAADYAGAAGGNPNITVFDELWAYTTERARRLWDEMVPPPTRRAATRLTVTYAGFEGESTLLEELYNRGIAGKEIAPRLFRAIGLLMAWHHNPVAPWQTPAWLEQMKLALRPNQYLRMIENRFVTTESTFLPVEWWDAITKKELQPVVADRELSVWVGVDASTKRDSTAVVAVTWDPELKRVRLVWFKIWQPSHKDPLDFEATIETTLLELAKRFAVRKVRFDPWQLMASAQRLTRAGVPMEEFPQTVPNLTEASSNLYDLVKGRNLAVYPDGELRLAVSHAVALEGTRGWRIAKEKAAHKIDVVVALAQACLAAVQAQGHEPPESAAPIGMLKSELEVAEVFDQFSGLEGSWPP